MHKHGVMHTHGSDIIKTNKEPSRKHPSRRDTCEDLLGTYADLESKSLLKIMLLYLAVADSVNLASTGQSSLRDLKAV